MLTIIMIIIIINADQWSAVPRSQLAGLQVITHNNADNDSNNNNSNSSDNSNNSNNSDDE